MSEDSEQTAQTMVSLSHKRILRAMVVVSLLGFAFGCAIVSWQFGLGVLIGGALALVNYFWLKNSLRAVFIQAADTETERPKFLAGRYFLRYLAFGAILLIVFLTKSLPVTSVLFGLASFAFAVLIEGFIRLFSTFFNK